MSTRNKKHPWDPVGRAYAPRNRSPLPPADRMRTGLPPLDVTGTLKGKKLLVVGGTGFLGKVLIGMLLKRFPDVGHIYLVVRAKGGLSSKERFEQEVWITPCLDPCRDDYSVSNETGKIDLYTKLTPIPGDVVEELGGVKGEWLTKLVAEKIDLLVNVAGVVSFDPPLDEGMQVNVVGVKNLLNLARALKGPSASGGLCAVGDAVPMVHTSTCYVAGCRTGTIFERDPREWPFPRCDVLDKSTWDPERELKEGMDIAAHLRTRVNDADLQSQFLDRARTRLRELHRPTTGEPLAQAIAKERTKWIDDELGEMGMKRAKHWGWPNTYTYTKSIGEQILAASGQPFTIVRPAVVESSSEFPFPGWNEGINTSAPLIYLGLHGLYRVPCAPGNILDVVPVDFVCAGTILSMAALLRNEHAAVYQYGTGDTNGLTIQRLCELTSLFKRKFMRGKTRGNPLMNRTLARFGPAHISKETYVQSGAGRQAQALALVSGGLGLLTRTPAGGMARGARKQVDSIQKQIKMVDTIMNVFMPFINDFNYDFRCDNTRQDHERTLPADKALLPWKVNELDWRHYLNEVHIKGLRKWVFPHLEAKLTKRPRPEDRFSDLVSFLEEIADREGGNIAVQRLVPVARVHGSAGKHVNGTSNGNGAAKVAVDDDDVHSELYGVSYRDLRRRAHATATRLADVGVHPGMRVALIAKNSPEWAIAFFGVLCCGGSVVPLDPALPPAELGRRMREVEADFALTGVDVSAPEGAACLDLMEFVESPRHADVVVAPEVLISPDDVAVIAYTAGTTGPSKPVVLTHKNLTSVLASVAPLFKITRKDSGLSVLPLTSTFELTCGLLLPLLRGARVTYVDDVTAEKLSEAFQIAGITAMIGVPQVWEDLEAKLRSDLADSGPFAEAAFKAGQILNRTLGKTLGINLGRVLFSRIHDRLGGRVRFLISTGGPVPTKTAETFRSLGIELKQSYGMTEATPVLAVGDKRGQKAVPGVQVEIRDVRDDGVGEIVARGDTVMRGYLDEELTAQTIDDGWLRTGDLGRIDKEGRIFVVARHDEVITLQSGKRVYPRTLEEQLEGVSGIDELVIVGMPDGQGGERIGCLVVVKKGELPSAVERSVAWAARKIDESERPSLIKAITTPLPRTSDKKVKRTEALALLIASIAEAEAQAAAASSSSKSPALLPSEVLPRESRTVTEDRLTAPGMPKPKKPEKDAPLVVPAPVKAVLKGALGTLQKAFYDRVLNVDVEGAQNIPWDRPTIVAANHASHLDMGLVKTALGDYGKDIIALAAKDYFFEGKWRRTYFENLTNLRPLDRGDNPREAMREASGLLESGQTVLIFPEGTRTGNGEMGTFRPAVSWLALKHRVDILPVYIEGTHRSMPRGSFVPKNRKVGVRIGKPIEAAALQAAVDAAGLRPSTAIQKMAAVVQKAVEALRDERTFHLERALDELLGRAPKLINGSQHSEGKVDEGNGQARVLSEIFTDLRTRFQRDEVREPCTWYFSLGEFKEAKWTVQVTKEACLIVNDKLDGRADCVFKTDAKTFTRIIRDHYIPDVSEFMNGTVKTNNPELLSTFIQVFNL
ncbi:MAG: AMP-binding protein [Deltaproteobacteria bacterium]|nr:AMP-binding protein [Deltaproteobacteria bacterium]